MSDSVSQAPWAADGAPADQTLTEQLSLPDRLSAPEEPPYRVLIVDDYQEDRELLKEWLEETSHFVVIGEAPDGPRGVALAAQLRPDLVTLDMSMPGGFGEAVTQTRAACPDSTVVVVSGFISDAMAHVCVDLLGASAYLHKDIGPARLAEELLRLMERPGEALDASGDSHNPKPAIDSDFVTNARLAAIVESSADAIIGLTLDGVVTSWNAAAEQMYECDADKIIGRHCSELSTLERFDELAPVFEQIRRGERIQNFETRRLRRDGTVLDASVSISPIREASGALIGTSAVSRDITEHKLADNEKFVTHSRLAAIVESSCDAIIGKTLDGTITSWNGGAERLYGYTADEIQGQNISLLIPTESADELPDILRRVARGEPIEHCETRRVRKDCTIVDVSLAISPILDKSGTVVGASTVARDITARRLVDAELARQAEDLRRSNDELEQFAYVASHDLSEPLRTIAGYVELLARRYQGQLDDDADRFIMHTVEGCSRMRQLIDDLLSYSRAGHTDELTAPVDCSIVVKEVLGGMQVVLAEKGAEVDYEDLPTVRGDSGQLGQLFQNLIANGIKFVRSGAPPRVHIEAQRQDEVVPLSV
jgi:PAS domain S-box-containing protein